MLPIQNDKESVANIGFSCLQCQRVMIERKREAEGSSGISIFIFTRVVQPELLIFSLHFQSISLRMSTYLFLVSQTATDPLRLLFNKLMSCRGCTRPSRPEVHTTALSIKEAPNSRSIRPRPRILPEMEKYGTIYTVQNPSSQICRRLGRR
ncbi:uncharacterized protein EI90DRAFT_297055 [Cantharellus anzutake]|uniref:uncharacterized protein n=1 Tax=Cantharellus anzutake TaxID=1750568 RepID=UPI001903E648|nr:uncharacterized protein EI90DRAFT_297055 [Cantharellus anzutake]KAF8315978.1 hypothetical protein EI90DRAFT_297055 [Cantharellus anzutake]